MKLLLLPSLSVTITFLKNLYGYTVINFDLTARVVPHIISPIYIGY